MFGFPLSRERAEILRNETPETANDLTEDERHSVAHKILFKSDPRWNVVYQYVKAILATREHKGRA